MGRGRPPTCPYCNNAKEFFKENDLEYTDYNVAEDESKRDEMIEKSGQMGVPVIFIDDKMIIGFDKEEIKKILKMWLFENLNPLVIQSHYHLSPRLYSHYYYTA